MKALRYLIVIILAVTVFGMKMILKDKVRSDRYEESAMLNRSTLDEVESVLGPGTVLSDGTVDLNAASRNISDRLDNEAGPDGFLETFMATVSAIMQSDEDALFNGGQDAQAASRNNGRLGGHFRPAKTEGDAVRLPQVRR